jgi:hypothetical protein
MGRALKCLVTKFPQFSTARQVFVRGFPQKKGGKLKYCCSGAMTIALRPLTFAGCECPCGSLKLTDRCDSCGRLAEVYQLPDRRDNNCTECNGDISTLILLYRKFAAARPDSEQAEDLEDQLVTILQRFLGRSRFGASARLRTCPEAVGKGNYIN